MKKIILLDPNFSADPISDKLLECGYYVIRVGKLTGRPRVKDHEIFIEIDYSNMNEILEFYRKEQVHQIIPGCTDLSFKISNEIGLNLNLPGYSETRNVDYLLSKKKLSKFLEDMNIPHPRTLHSPLKSIPESFKAQNWIAKPNIGFSGKDVTKIDFKEESASSIKIRKLIENNDIILQEFVNGTLYSFSGILKDSKVIQSNVVLEECISSNWKVDLSYIDRTFPTEFKNELVKIAEKISRKTNKISGLIHMQFILSQTGPKVIELIERMPGDLYSHLVEWSDKATFVSGYLSNFLPNQSFNESADNIKKSLIRVTTNSSSLQKFIKKNPPQSFELINLTNVKRSNTLNSNVNQEVVAFLNFLDDESMKDWLSSDQKYCLYKD
jgi:predicted ATP-grasp superfamily ATP-dependent carboligase